MFLVKNSDNNNELSSAVIEEKLNKVFSDFSINKSWISKISLNHPVDSAKYFYKIRIPKSIKHPVLLNELNLEFSDLPVNIEASEESIGGNTILKIMQNSSVVFYGKLIYDESIRRDFSKLSFFVLADHQLDSLDLIESKSFLPTFEFLLKITDDIGKVIKQSKKYGLHYSVLLDDDISNDFLLEESETKKSLITGVLKIISNFNEAKHFIVDGESDLHNSKIFPFIKLEFSKRKTSLVLKQNFHDLTSRSIDEQKSLLNYYCESYKNQEMQKIIISFNDLLLLKNEIQKARLKGHQFINTEMQSSD